jgi:predicted ATPase
MPQAVRPIAERTIALSEEHGFPLWLAGARLWLGWTEVELGDPERGLAEIRQGINALEAAGALPWVHFAYYLLAGALAKTGQLRDAAQLVDRTFDALSGTGERWYEAELHRIRGDLLLDSNEAPEAAEACYAEAIKIAERQGARLWKLRAVNALVALWHLQGKNLQDSRLAALCADFDECRTSADQERAVLLATTSRGQ